MNLKLGIVIVASLLLNKVLTGQSRSSEGFRFGEVLWGEKIKDSKVGPGPNYFGLSKKNVYLDKKNRLHLQLIKKKGVWTCAEVYSKDFFQEGTYEVEFYCVKNTIPDNIVLGLFFYDGSNAPLYNELDFELSKWDKSKGNNAQHVIYSSEIPTVKRFYIPFVKQQTKHTFTIDHDSIYIESRISASDSLLLKSSFNRPKEFDFSKTRFRLNLWLTGKETKKTKSFHVVVTSFKHTK